MLPGAEPFFLPAGPIGILLLHGFTGSPGEMRLLGENLQRQGFSVLAPRLAGHGTQVEDLAHTTWQDWYEDALDGYHLLRGVCERVAVVGQSMGALLALRLATVQPVTALGLLAPAVAARDQRLSWVGVLRHMRAFVRRPKKHFADLAPEFFISYDQMPTRALYELHLLMQETRAVAEQIRVPVWIGQSRADRTVVPDGAHWLYGWLSVSHKELHWLEQSGHILTLDREREEVFRRLGEFLHGYGTGKGKSHADN